jgi:exonuclease SbcC
VRIGRVRVRNIRSYRDATLEIGPGTTLLVGDVGSGKTSLLYAVEMALFGAAEIDAAYLIRHGSAEAEVSVQLLEDGHVFEVSRAFRRVRRKGRDAIEPTRLAYTEDGASTAYSATELRQRVIDLLGFRDNPNPRAHSDLWRWAVYVPQERMREILVAAPGERLQTIRRALGVERYRVAAENAREVARDLRQVARGQRDQADRLARFTEEHARATEEVTRLLGERGRVEAAEAALSLDREAARGTATEATRAVLALEGERREHDALTAQAEVDRRLVEALERGAAEREHASERLSVEIDQLSRRVAELPARHDAWTRAQEETAGFRLELDRRAAEQTAGASARARLVDLDRRRLDLERDLAGLRAEEERLSNRHVELSGVGGGTEPVAPVPESPASIERDLAAARRTEADAERTLALARHERDEVLQLLTLGVCPRCGQAVRATEFTRHREEAEDESVRAERVLEENRVERERLERTRAAQESFVRLHDHWRAVRAQLEEIARAQERVSAAIRAAGDRLAETTTMSGAVRAEVEHARSQETGVGPARDRLERAMQVEREARDRWSEADRATAELPASKTRLDRLVDERARGEQDAALLAGRSRVRDARLLVLAAALAREEETRATARIAENRLASLEQETRVASEGRVQLLARLEAAEADRVRAEKGRKERELLLRGADEVELKAAWVGGPFHASLGTMETRVLERAQAEFQRHFQRFFAALIDDPETSATVDGEFTPSAEIRGQSTPAEALSGGERTSLALAYRLALSRVVRVIGELRLETLLLDEPTDGFSPEQVQSMGELLEELALPQVVVVSHERELEGVADRVVRVEKEDGRSVLRGPGTSRPDPSEGSKSTPATT